MDLAQARQLGLIGTLHAIIVEPWARIDVAAKGPRVGRLSAREAAFVTVVTVALMLTVLRFVVMDRGIQAGFASMVCEGVGLFSARAKLVLYDHHRLLVNCSWVVGCVACYLVVPAVVVRVIFGMTLGDFYLTPRNYLRHLPVYGLLFLPVGILIIFFAGSPDFAAQYPFYKDQRAWTDLLVWEAFYGVQFFALEFFFRGFLLQMQFSERCWLSALRWLFVLPLRTSLDSAQPSFSLFRASSLPVPCPDKGPEHSPL